MAKRLLKSVNEALVVKVAEAIAAAEGFNVKGSIPARNHNPGDLTADTIGRAIGKEGMYVTYAKDSDGWDALYQQVRLMFNGGSRVYTSDMTISQVAAKYAPSANERDVWAANVAAKLGVSVFTKLSELTA